MSNSVFFAPFSSPLALSILDPESTARDILYCMIEIFGIAVNSFLTYDTIVPVIFLFIPLPTFCLEGESGFSQSIQSLICASCRDVYILSMYYRRPFPFN